MIPTEKEEKNEKKYEDKEESIWKVNLRKFNQKNNNKNKRK